MTSHTGIRPWSERGPDAYRCAECGTAWVINRDPDVDNAEMMTELMADHFCFPGVSIVEVDGVWEEAQRIAAQLPGRQIENRPADELTREEWAKLSEEADMEHAAGEGLALTFDCNAALLATAEVHAYCGERPRWERIVTWAASATRRALEGDDVRARHLASMVANGIPAAADAFRPQHARMARGLLAEMHARALAAAETEGDGWRVPSIEEADDWLARFEGEARAIL